MNLMDAARGALRGALRSSAARFMTRRPMIEENMDQRKRVIG